MHFGDIEYPQETVEQVGNVQEEKQPSEFNYEQYYPQSDDQAQNTSSVTAVNRKQSQQQINPLSSSDLSIDEALFRRKRDTHPDAQEEMKVFFFYDLIPKNMESSILPDHLSEDPKRILLKQTLIPLAAVVVLYEALMYPSPPI